MRNNRYLAGWLALAALAASCSKKAAETPSPAAVQDTAMSTEEGVSMKSKNMWTTYLDNIEAGKQKDLKGQYVSKDTRVPDGDGSSPRPTRPKASLVKDPVTNLYPQPTDPISDCPDGCPGSGGPPEPSSGFSSSEGVQMGVNPVDNPNNYILNVTIIKGDYPFGLEARSGFSKIPIDLNKGSGGKTIYLCYTRYSGNVAEAPRYESSGGIYQCINGTQCGDYPDRIPVTGITATSESFLGTTNPTKYTGWDWVWNYTGVWPYYWKYPDLNDGAGGRYIYAEVTKGLRAGLYPALPTAPFKEIGVIYSNDENVQPPAGWKRNYQDLNEGAGGYYIYFCFKN